MYLLLAKRNIYDMFLFISQPNNSYWEEMSVLQMFRLKLHFDKYGYCHVCLEN